MRKKRSSTHQKSKKTTLYQAASLVSIAAFGIAQVIPSSHAAFSSSATISDGHITTAVVFPQTIQEILDHIEEQQRIVEEGKDLANKRLETTYGASSSEEAREYANEINEIADKSSMVLEDVYMVMTELRHYLALAKVEAERDESGEKVVELVLDGITTATKMTEKMEDYLVETEYAVNEAGKVFGKLVISEKAATEKQLIVKITEETMERLTASNTLASELLSMYEEEFDPGLFSKLTEEFSKSDNQLINALEDSKKVASELKAFMDDDKETYTEEVLVLVKENYEKVQVEREILKKLIKKLKTVNAEALKKMEQDNQKQVDEERKGEQTNESTDKSNQQVPSVEEEDLAEKIALEQGLIEELLEEAFESLKESNAFATDLLSKYEEEFDLETFTKLTGAFYKTEKELQKGLEVGEKYRDELNAYIKGGKETYEDDVLAQAKQNFEHVQSELETLEKAIEKIKTENKEALNKIEQEEQRQVEEAARQEEERLAKETTRLEEKEKQEE